MKADRFVLHKGHGRRMAWVVEDRDAPKYEDARLYGFTSRRKAIAFQAQMVAEHGNHRRTE